jgi:hypothetical protein
VKSWDVAKIYSMFSANVAATVIRTPLLEEVKEDQLVWQDERNGIYSVRSGYKRYMKDISRGLNNKVEGDWKCLWRISAPPKTKHLLWRVCRGCLPVRVRLHLRHVPCPTLCPLCLNDDEDDWHAFFGCVESKRVWNEVGLGAVMNPRIQRATNVQSLIFEICRDEEETIVGTVAVVMWFIWNNRNNWVWNEVKEPTRGIAMSALHLIREWRAVNVVQQCCCS